MNKVVILTDSCADLSTELRQQYGIDYVKMNTVYEGKETPASLDWEYYTPKELYDIMREGNRVMTTQVPKTEFDEKFEKYASEGCDIVYVACSLKLSASVNTGAVAADEVMAKYPNVKIFCINSKNSSCGEGILAMQAAKLRDEGKSAQEIAEAIEKNSAYINQMVTLENLNCLKRAGRVTGSSAFFGNLFGIKPIIISDKNGQNLAVKKIKGRQNSINEVVAMTKEAVVDPENQYVIIAHADCLPEAEELKAKVLEEIPFAGAHICIIGPIVGASVGPGTIGTFFVGKEVVRDGDAEAAK